MVRIVITEELRKKLLPDGSEVVELCDESGRLLARLIPQNPKAVIPEGWEPMFPEPTEEEVQRMIDSGERGITTADLMDRIRQRRGTK